MQHHRKRIKLDGLAMPFFDVKSRYITLLMLSAGVSPACGARIEIDSSGSGSNPNQGTKIDDAGAILDAGPLHDAAYCSRQSACAYSCCGMCNRNEVGTLNIVDCGIQLKSSPTDAARVIVYVDCDLVLGPYFGDAGLMLNPQGWTIDYSISPARLVFGAALCQQLQSMQGVPIYVYMGCNCIN